MRSFKFVFLLSLLSLSLGARASNSDSLDILHFGIHVDTIVNAPTSKKIVAHTDVQLVSTVNSLSTISLDLDHFQVDSVFVNGLSTPFSYNDTLIAIHPASAPAMGDTVTVTVWYQGRSIVDPGGFGGLYFATNGIFNLGVGLTTNPHPFGRAWFPCKDNFTDRSFYDFYVRVDSSLKAICNGTLQSVTNSGGAAKTWHWNLRDDIVSYLASFAVAAYQHVARHYVSISGDTLPYDIYALAGDTTLAKSQSQRLLTGIAAFENHFGPYSWERLGYVLVNESAGAMEHATNIGFPRGLIGIPAYETIWAHEASHHWFGDLVTCDKEEEMWLNEGWASYCESIFEEAAYGFNAYKNYNRSTHADVLRRAHLEDGGYQVLSNMPHAYTYGRTVYSRGGLVAHTLRGQLGDTDFFSSVTTYLNEHKWGSTNSDSLQHSLERATGENLQNFFDTWVNQAGYLHFSLDSFFVTSGGPLNQVHIAIRQRLKAATSYGNSFKLPLRLLGAAWERLDTTVIVTGATQSFSIPLAWTPVAVVLDPEEWIADVTTDNYQTIRTTGTKTFANTWADVVVDSLVDSAWVQITHNFIPPDSFWAARQGIKLSRSRYWTIHGILPAGFHANGKFYYNGTTSSTAGLLDNTWLTNREDSLLIFYRPSAAYDWQEVTNVIRNTGANLNDKTGNLVVPDLMQGDYAMGIYDNFVAVDPSLSQLVFTVHPNPNDGRFQVDLPNPNSKFEVRMIDAEGQLIHQTMVENQASLSLEKAYLANGWYIVTVTDEAGRVGSQRILIER